MPNMDAESSARAQRAAAIEKRLNKQKQQQSAQGSATTTAAEQDLLKKLRRIVDLQIMGDNRYDKATECLETLEKILSNILAHPSEEKYRSLKTTNPRLKRSVLTVSGGTDYLLHSGLGTRTVTFQEEWYLASATASKSPSSASLRKVELAHKVLKDRIGEARERSEAAKRYKEREEAEEKGRVGRALQEAEEDRAKVRRRVEREKAARERRARMQQEGVEGQDSQGSAWGMEADPSSQGITPGDYTAEVPFDAPSMRSNDEQEDADDQGERPPPYGAEQWGSGRRLGDSTSGGSNGQ